MFHYVLLKDSEGLPPPGSPQKWLRNIYIFLSALEGFGMGPASRTPRKVGPTRSEGSESWPGLTFPGLCRGLGRVDAWLGSGWGCPLPPRQPPGPPRGVAPSKSKLFLGAHRGPPGATALPNRVQVLSKFKKKIHPLSKDFLIYKVS